jgi:mono/diheme cytochrome c family protein
MSSVRIVLPMLALALAAGCGDTKPTEAPKASTEAKAEKPAEAPKAAPAKPAEAPKATADAEKPDGKAIYTQYCVACHGADGKGNNGLGGDYSVVLKDRDDAELIASIKNGKQGSIGAMPPWGAILNDAQVEAVLAYVKTEFGPK